MIPVIGTLSMQDTVERPRLRGNPMQHQSGLDGAFGPIGANDRATAPDEGARLAALNKRRGGGQGAKVPDSQAALEDAALVVQGDPYPGGEPPVGEIHAPGTLKQLADIPVPQADTTASAATVEPGAGEFTLDKLSGTGSTASHTEANSAHRPNDTSHKNAFYLELAGYVALGILLSLSDSDDRPPDSGRGHAIDGNGDWGSGDTENAILSVPLSDHAPDGSPALIAPNASFAITQSRVGESGKPILAGTGTTGSLVTLDIDTNGDQVNDVVYHATVDSTGRWSVDISTDQPVNGSLPAAGLGASTIIEAAQTTGDRVSRLPGLRLTEDKVAPDSPRLDPIATDNIINAAELRERVTLSGTAEARSRIRVNWDDEVFTTTAGATGQWKLDIPRGEVAPAFISGRGHKVEVSVLSTDAAGNASAPVSRVVTIDNKPPEPPVILFTGGTDNYLNATEELTGITMRGTAEANSTVELTIETRSLVSTEADSSGKWSVRIPGHHLPGTDGRYSVQATATDEAGNVSARSETATLIVDTTAPVIDDLHAGSGNIVRSGESFRISGETEAGATLVISYFASPGAFSHTSRQTVEVSGFDGDQHATWRSWFFSAPRIAQTETHRVVINATDKAGNTSVTTHTFLVSGDGRLSGDAPDGARPDASIEIIGMPLRGRDLFSDLDTRIPGTIHAAPGTVHAAPGTVQASAGTKSAASARDASKAHREDPMDTEGTTMLHPEAALAPHVAMTSNLQAMDSLLAREDSMTPPGFPS